MIPVPENQSLSDFVAILERSENIDVRKLSRGWSREQEEAS